MQKEAEKLMVEKKILVDDMRLQYTGLFEITELYRLFDQLIHERGYVKQEKKSDQFNSKAGRQIYLEIRPVKEFEQDFMSTIKVRIKMSDVRDVVKNVNGRKKEFNQGTIMMVFDGWTTTFYEFAWETKPMFVFLRMLIDKYIYKISFGKYEGEIINDVHYIYDKIKAHLNLYKYAADSSNTNTGNEEKEAAPHGTNTNISGKDELPSDIKTEEVDKDVVTV